MLKYADYQYCVLLVFQSFGSFAFPAKKKLNNQGGTPDFRQLVRQGYHANWFTTDFTESTDKKHGFYYL